ncbi:MAG: hypothetical protein D6767_07970 [Candidatus Hydrogenedentota bacterium]|nr:MAG: hypothetical protein D6767_07970 [Candidatus Hydrogenedentota bacterium]
MRLFHPILLIFFSSLCAVGFIYSQATDDSTEHWEKAKELLKKDTRPSDKWTGSFTLRITGGIYDFTRVIENPNTKELREYSLPFGWTMLGVELAVRGGKDHRKFHKGDGASFSYYRSNSGFFIDMELGMRTYCGTNTSNGKEQNCLPPSVYSVTVKKPGQQDDYLLIDLAEKNWFVNDPILKVPVPLPEPKDALKDGITYSQYRKSGRFSAYMTEVYFNNYFHFTPLNFLLNFGSKFRWFDASIGPGIRIFKYDDYSDPKRMLNYDNDNMYATFNIVTRIYIQEPFTDRGRIRVHYYWPFYAAIAKWMEDPAFNSEEHLLDIGFDLYLIKYLYGTIGYRYSWWNINTNSPDRFNEFRPGFETTERTSGEFYGGVAVDIVI